MSSKVKPVWWLWDNCPSEIISSHHIKVHTHTHSLTWTFRVTAWSKPDWERKYHLHENGLQLAAVFPTVALGEEDLVGRDAVVGDPAVSLQHPDDYVWEAVLWLSEEGWRERWREKQRQADIHVDTGGETHGDMHSNPERNTGTETAPCVFQLEHSVVLLCTGGN